MDESNKSSVIFDGIPTGPEVRMLMKAFPDLQADSFLSYDEIGAEIKESYGENRFRTVLSSWRRALQEQGLVTECVPSQGIRVMTDSDVIASAYGGVNSARKKIRRTAKKISVIRPEDERIQAEALHARTLLAKTEQAMKESERQLLSAPNIVPMPRRKM